jgi:hypothetical protein
VLELDVLELVGVGLLQLDVLELVGVHTGAGAV